MYMRSLTPTELRKNIYKVLDEVLATGIPVEILRKGRTLKIIATESVDKLQNLSATPKFVIGNPDDLPDVHWDDEIKRDNSL